MKRKAVFSIFLAGLAVLLLAVDMLKHPQGPLPELTPVLSSYAEKHMLYGDDRGGGHLHGIGKACKSEFPAHWEASEVISHVKNIAANDNLDWEKQKNGYHVAEEMIEKVRVRVVLNKDKTKIVTAYPTNVKRNPCPEPANDN